MNEVENLYLVKEIYRAFRNHNFAALRECLAEDVRWFAIGPPDLIPTAGTRYGPDQVAQYFEILSSVEAIRNFEPDEFIVSDNKVVALGQLERFDTANGSLLRSPWVHIFILDQRRVCDFRSFYDTAAAVASLASVPFQIGRAS